MAGEITTLGVGSGIDLQGMLEQLREVDQETVSRKENQIIELEEQLNEFTSVNNMLLSLKSAALDLSLSSTYLGRIVTSSDEDVATATVLDGFPAQSASLEVTRLAANSSWLSAEGMASANASVYVPTQQESTTGVVDSAGDIIAHAGETMTISFAGDSDNPIVINVAADMTMDELVTTINSHADNVGSGDNGRQVTAETYERDGETFLRIRSDDEEGIGEDNRVSISEDFVDIDFAAPDKDLFYQVGDGDTVSVTVAADTTITQLAALINDGEDNPGVTARVINDGDGTNPYRLSLQSDSSGEDGRIAFLSQLADMTMEENQGAEEESLNAQFSIDAIQYQRQSNTVSDVISGVTLSLEETGTATISISDNAVEVKEMVQTLVTAYNDAIQEINEKTSYDSEAGEFGILSGTTVRDLSFSLQSLMTSFVDTDGVGNNITSLFDLGLEFNRDGSISLDEEMLDQAMADNPEGVEAFFLGDSDNDIEGFADKVNTQMRTITAGDGQIAGEKSAAQSRIDDLELKIEGENERLDKKYELLTKQFIELDRYMNQMTSISGFLTSQFDSMANAWGGGKD
ncbi:MAG: flagellar filament capping protein FliD [Thermodesulfobacteriota bacterium]|nr:flagellar filament capping protein FliD [Thermodesulfobacteriota bacterium]